MIFFSDGCATEISHEGYCLWGRCKKDDFSNMTWQTWNLIGWLKGALQANYSITLQYQDPEFNNELCNLTDLSGLPEKPTIKVIPMIECVPISAQNESFYDTTARQTLRSCPTPLWIEVCSSQDGLL